MKLEKPWSVQLELTEGCNRRCRFCGIHSLYREDQDMGYKFMTSETAKKIAISLNEWLGKTRLEFALQGEPLLNKDVNRIFNIFRTYFPKGQIMTTTNGDPIRKGKSFNSEKIFDLFKSGLNILVLDYYGEKHDPTYDEFFQMAKEASNGIPVFDFYKNKTTVWGYESNKIMKIVVIDNTVDRNFQRDLNNQAGNTNPQYVEFDTSQIPRMVRCHQPFRELSVKHDGAVPICCMDWGREHIMGKFPEDGSFQEIWKNEHIKRARSLLWNKRRDLLSPCDRCNYHPVKAGFMEDPYPEGHPDLLETAKKIKEFQQQNKKYAGKYADDPFKY